jgi:hypothetical protein
MRALLMCFGLQGKVRRYSFDKLWLGTYMGVTIFVDICRYLWILYLLPAAQHLCNIP